MNDIVKRLCAELTELIDNRNAIDIIAERHNCTGTDILILIGATDEFDVFDKRRRPKPKKKVAVKQSETLLLYNDGATIPQIAQEQGVTERAIYMRLYKQGALKKVKVISDDELIDIMRMRDEGMSYHTISAITGHPATTICGYVQKGKMNVCV